MRPSLSLVSSLVLLFASAALVAGDLPSWTDDSGITLTPYPRNFAPQRETTNLVARVYHPIDSPTEIFWRVNVRDDSGQLVREFQARQTFQPGEAMLFAPTWDGRDGSGRFLPNGTYQATVEVEMRATGERPATRVHRESDSEEHEARASVIRQRFSHTVIIDSLRLGRRVAPHFQTPHETGYPYNFYFGTLHNQSRYSDGGHPNTSSCASSTTHGGSDLDPAQAYTYGRNTGGLDFLGITDHNHQFENACSGCSATQVVQRYHDGLTAAANATVNGSFVGIYGMEWGYISNPDAGFTNEGHVGIYESPKLFGWEPSSCTIGSTCYYEVFTASSSSGYAPMYTKALQNPSPWGAFGQFNHPSDGTKSAGGQGVDFNSIQYTTDGDDFIHTVAVISGPATGFSTSTTDTGALYAGEPVNGPNYAAYTSIDMYNRILGAGYHVAPVADPDVHCANYGTSTRDRTVILASSLTKAAIFDAIHNRRVYATSDANAQLIYTMNAGGTIYHQGAGGIRTSGPLATSGAITLHVSAWDPDAGETAASIKIKEPVPGNTNGADTVIATATSSPFDYTFTPSSGNHTYYVYVTMNTGDRIWSAPIWINHSGTPDTTPPATSITSPANGATVSGTTTVAASASDNVGVTRVEFLLDNVLQNTDTTSPYQWSWNTTTSANGSHSLNSRAWDAANNSSTSPTVAVTVSNVADTTPPTAPANLVAAVPTSGNTKKKINLTWTASSDNVGVTGYQIWRATSSSGPFSQIATTTSTSYMNSGLVSGSTYWYYVKAYDAAGNVSAASNTSSATAR